MGMFLPRTLTTAIAMALCVAFAQVARAEDRRVAVLTLSSDVASDPLVARMSEAMRNAARGKPGYSLSDTKASLDQLSMMQDCEATEAACVDQIARALGADALIHGSLARKGIRTVYVVAEVLDTASGATRAAKANFTAEGADDLAVAIQASALIDELLEIHLAEMAGPQAAPVVAEAPRPEPGAAEPARTEPAPAEDDGQGPSVRAIAGYSLLGVAVLSAGLTVLSFAQVAGAEGDAAFDDYRRAVGQMNPGAADVCEEAEAGKTYGLDDARFTTVKDQCSTGQTYDVLQYVFLGTTVIAGGLSAWLLLGDDDDEQASRDSRAVALRPIIGKKSAGLSARVRF
jgi:hypothetical protein